MYINNKIPLENTAVLGTCLAKNLSRWLYNLEICNEITPYGTLFNPLSIEIEITRLFKKVELNYFVNDDGKYIDQCRTWQKFDSLSELHNYNNDFNEKVKKYFFKSSCIFISYGLIELWMTRNYPDFIFNKLPVDFNNIDEKVWVSRLSDSEEIENSIVNTIKIVRDSISKLIPIIFAVCPVGNKFTKTGKEINELNNITKKTLLISIKHAISTDINCYYFPLYENLTIKYLNKTSLQLDNRHILPSVLCDIYNSFLLFTHNSHKFVKRNFFVPYYNEKGEIIGKIFEDDSIELYK